MEANKEAGSNIVIAGEKMKRNYARRTNHAATPRAASPESHTAEEKGKRHTPGFIVPKHTRPVTPSATLTAASPAASTAASLAAQFAAQHAVTAPAMPAPAVPMPALTPAISPGLAPLASAVAPAATSHVAPAAALPYAQAPSSADTCHVQKGDFVLVRKHEKVRKSGSKKGKLADKVTGPFLVHEFTDFTKRMTILQDAEGLLFKKPTSDLSVYRGTS